MACFALLPYRIAGHVLGVQFGGGLLPSSMSDVEQLAPRNSSASRRRITRFIVAFSFRPKARPGRTWSSGSIEFRKLRLIYGLLKFLIFRCAGTSPEVTTSRSLPDFSFFL
jgi:hypothetical protein